MKFNLKFNSQDKEFAQEVEKKLNEAYLKFKSIFKKNYDGSVDVVLFSTRLDYKNWTGYGDKYQNWMVGKCVSDKNEIGIITPREAERPTEEMLLVAKHELFHYLLNKCFGEIRSIVLDEGIACYLSEQMPERKIEEEEIVSCLKLETDEFAQLGGYMLTPIYIKYIVENLGYERVKELINADDYTTLLPKDFEKVAIKEYNKLSQKRQKL